MNGKRFLSGKVFCIIALIALTLSFLPFPNNLAFAASIIYVDADATGNNNGTSWTDAYTSLQDALNAASSSKEIWVAEGTYKPTVTTDRTISFQLKSGVAVYGGFDGTEANREERDWITNVTALSGDIGASGNSGDNSYHVVTGVNYAVLDGFTITSGNANGTDSNSLGGGMYNISSSPLVANCIFDSNSSAWDGGGMYNSISSPTVINCTFIENIAS